LDHQIRKKCDCGNSKWQWTFLKEDIADSQVSFRPIYRCIKCDALAYADILAVK
jgi:hypothetical protein